MIKKGDRSFVVNIELHYHHDQEGDDELAKGGNASGSFWQVSISDIKDSEGRILNKQSVFQWESLCKAGGLTRLLKDLVGNIPRFVDQNGLPSK